MPTPALPVVCAIIEDDAGRVLVAQRPPHKHLGLKWEFPGGKVEAGESPEAALTREIKEELGCDIHVLRPLARFFHDYGSVQIEMLPFRCALDSVSTAPRCQEHMAIRWATLAELGSIDFAPADLPVIAMLQSN